MLSRVAEHLYWMARYLERAENTARFVLSVALMRWDLPLEASFAWSQLLHVIGLEQEYGEHLQKEASVKSDAGSSPSAEEKNDEDEVMSFLIAGAANPSAITSCIRRARENARTVREVLADEVWQEINALHLLARDYRDGEARERGLRQDFLDGVIAHHRAVVGALDGTMSRDLAHEFVTLGRYLERADMSARFLRVPELVALPPEHPLEAFTRERLWLSTLEALSALQMYRRHVCAAMRPRAAEEFLLRDRHFPRSVWFCLDAIEGALANLPERFEALRYLRQCWKLLETPDGSTSDSESGLLWRNQLAQLQCALARLHDAIAQHYFLR